MRKAKREIVFGGNSFAARISLGADIKAIQSLPLPFVGNKKKLLGQLWHTFNDYCSDVRTVIDAFSGSSVVSMLLKAMNKNVLSNDVLTCCYLYAVALVENSNVKLNDADIEYLLTNENENAGTFVQDRWQHNYFTTREAVFLDNFRANIDKLTDTYTEALGLTANKLVCLRLPFGGIDKSRDIYSHRRKQIETYGRNSPKSDRRIGMYYDDDMNLDFAQWFPKYVRSIQSQISGEPESTDKAKLKRAIMTCVINSHVLENTDVGGRHHSGQVVARLDHRLNHQRSRKNVTIDRCDTETGRPSKEIWFTRGRMPFDRFSSMQGTGQCLATNCDIIELLRSGFVDVDCAYFDPPYGGDSSDYATLYRFFEEYVYGTEYQNLEHVQKAAKRFAVAKNYEKSFQELLEAAAHIPLWIFSYNDGSWANIDEIVSLIKKFKPKIDVKKIDYAYRLRDNRKKTAAEFILVAK